MDIEKHFSRKVWCLFGIPFDAISLEQAATEIVSAANENRRCFLSTPNLNFVCTAQTDLAFRESLINSDLNIVDGWPIVFVAKLLGIPITQRVAGSDLIEYLYQRDASKPLNVFFFGGEPGVGELATQKINQNSSGLYAVGNFAPGFGSVDEMSSADIIKNINSHKVDFLIAALGAKKGQAWIEKNRHQLTAPVISHLGAVINFFAGTVKRSPVKMQRLGLEWFWRIIQEPTIWKRYFFDGLTFLKLLIVNVFPYVIWLKFNKQRLNDETHVSAHIEETETTITLKLTGACTEKNIAALKPIFIDVARKAKDIVIDLHSVTILDSAYLGLCLLLLNVVKQNGQKLRFINAVGHNKKIIKWSGLSYLGGN
jgi:N-acetylglucosaminyldiphosphoundecaprenol N-acetyl-beta-D-mannosaminyltransferase